jgi:predicted chitinase
MGFRTVYGNTVSENGWRMCNADECVWIQPVPGVSLQVRSGIPATILGAFAKRFNDEIEPLRDRDTASWTPTNAVASSNHLAGTAMDLNWDSHPFHAQGTFGNRLPALRKLLKEFEGCVWWGGDWQSPIDEMHFQLNYGEGDKKLIAFAKKLIDKNPSTVFTPPLLLEILSDAMGGRVTIDRFQQLLPGVQQALEKCECDTIERISMWMAQIGHESGGLRYMEEIADGSAYEGRGDLGNTEPGDGQRFKGRGPIQITGRSNYDDLSEWAFREDLVPSPKYFVDNPEQLSSDRYGFLGVVWYWTVARPHINEMCDNNDLEGVTRAINGGVNGIDDRRARWEHCRAMGPKLLELVSTSPSTTEDSFLMALNDAEQRELLDLARQEASYRRVSRSPLRKLGEKETETILGFEWNTDGSVHVLLCYLLAKLGHPQTISDLTDLANADLGVHPDRKDGKQIAQAILTLVKREWASLNNQNSTPVSSTQPTPLPTYAPLPPQITPVIATPVAPLPASGTGLYSEVNDLRSLIREVTQSITATTQGD